MQSIAGQTKKHAALVLTFVAVVTIAAPSHLQAQNVWDKLKQGVKQAEQQQPKQQQAPQQQQQTAAQSATASYQPVAASSGANGSEPDSSCCTAEAMKKMAADASFLDIVGIKLGMTPQQATAAIKAHNPALHIYQVDLRLTHPGSHSFQRVPHFIVACNNCPGKNVPVGAEVITLEFTTPPNAPLLAVATRYTNFEPTLMANLVSSVEKKYGPEFHGSGSNRVWLYEPGGKPVTASSSAINQCAYGGASAVLMGAWPATPNGGAYLPEDRDAGGLDIDSFTGFMTEGRVIAQCMPYSVVWTDLYYDNGPNTQVQHVFVRIASNGLAYAAQRSSHDWLQAEADAQAKAAHDAAAKRTGTTF